MNRRNKNMRRASLRLLHVMLAVVIAFGLVPASSFAVAARDSTFGFDQVSDSSESYVIAKTDDASDIAGETVVSSLDDAYLLSYPSAKEAAEAAERLSEVCEFAEVDRPMMAAAADGGSGISQGYDDGADPFTVASETLAVAGSQEGADDSKVEGDASGAVEDEDGSSTGSADAVGAGESGDAADGEAVGEAGLSDGEEGSQKAYGPADEGLADEGISDDGAEPADDASAEEEDESVLVALVDSGAPENENVVDAVSVLGDDVEDENGHAAKVLDAILGQAPEVRVLSVRVLDEQAVGTVAATYAGIKTAVARGAAIVNLSLYAALDEESAAISSAVQEARDAGCVVVAAAGNAGQDAAGYVPANADAAITAGSCDIDGVRLEASNYGDDVDLYVVSEATSLAAGTVSGWLAANSDLSDCEGDLEQACGNGLFFATAEDPAESAEESGDSAADDASALQDGGEGNEAQGTEADNGNAEDIDKVVGAMSVSTTATELRSFRPRDESIVPKNEVVFDDGGKLALTDAKIGTLGSDSKPSGLTKKSLTLITGSGDAKDCYGVWISMPSTSGSTTKSVDGSFTLKWTNVASDADGNRLDLVLDVSDIKVRTNDSRAKKSKHILLFRNNSASGTGYLWMYSWTQALSDGTSGGRVGLTMRIKAHLYKTGTTTATSSKYLVRFSDIDQPDKSLKAASANDYSGTFVESVQLRSGFQSKAYLQKSFPKTEYKEENPTYGASLLNVDTSTAKFTATQRDAYGTYYRSGFLAQTSGGTFALQWWGSMCATALFTEYEGVVIRDKNDASVSGVTDRAIITKSVNAYGQKGSNQAADFDADTNHGGKRTKTSWRRTDMPWKGTATYNFSAKPGYRVSKVTLTYTPAPSSTSVALKQTTKTYTSGTYLSRIVFNNSTSEYASVRDYDIVVTTEKVPDATATIQATKTVEGATLADRQFTIGLYDSNKKLVESKTTTLSSATSQTLTFSPLSFVYDDTLYTSSNGYSRTYTYYVKETVPSTTRPYTYDETWHEVSVVVTYDDSAHTMSARVASGNNPTVKNTYGAAGGVRAKKVDAGNTGKTLAGAEFSIYEGVYGSVEATEGLTPVAVMTSGANGIADTGDVALPADGSVYTVVETKAPPGYYRNTEWYRNFTLSEDGQVADYVTDQADWCVDEAKPATVGLMASKTLEGGRIEANTYAFTIECIGANRDDTLSADPPMPASDIAYADEDGNAAFDEVTFTAAGTYYYLIREVEGDDPQTTYDTSVWLATVRIITSEGDLVVSSVKYQKGVLCALYTHEFEDASGNFWDDHCIVGVGASRDAAWKNAAQSWLELTDGLCKQSLNSAPDDGEASFFWDACDSLVYSNIVYYDVALQNGVETSGSAAAFRNTYEARCGVQAAKVDSETQGSLAGAVFEVSAASDGAPIYDADGVTTMDSMFITTGQDGIAKTHSKALVIGESYRIREVKSPSGYTLDDSQWHDFVASEAESIEHGFTCLLSADDFMRADYTYEDLALTGEGATQLEAWNAVRDVLSAYPYQGYVETDYYKSAPGDSEYIEIYDDWGGSCEGLVTYTAITEKVELLEDGAIIEAGTWSDSVLEARAVLRAHKQFFLQTGKGTREPRPITAGQFSFELLDEQGNVIQVKSCDASDTGEVDVAFDVIGYDADDAGQTFSYAIREKQGEERDIVYDDASRQVTVSVEERAADSQDGGTLLVADVSYLDGSCSTAEGLEAAGPFVNVLYPTYDVRVYKESADTGSADAQPLAGAEYTVFEWGSGPEGADAVDAPDVFKDTDDFAAAFVLDEARQSLSFDEADLAQQWGLHVAATLTTDSEGFGVTADGCLESGKRYVVLETKAPEGYKLNGCSSSDDPRACIYIIDDYADDGSFSHMAYLEGQVQAVRHLDAEGQVLSQDYDEAFEGYRYEIGADISSISWSSMGFSFSNAPVDTPRGGVLVQKVDAADMTTQLAGAWFDVYDDQEFSLRYDAWKEQNPTADDVAFLVALVDEAAAEGEGESVQALEPVCSLGPTDAHGWASTSASALEVGKVYRIVESIAPDGYDIPAYDFQSPNDAASGNATVQIAEEGSIQTVSTGGAYLKFADDEVIKFGSIDLSATKQLVGGVLEQGQFSFTLADEQETVIQTASNDASGSVTFQTLEFGMGDLGEHHYTIREVVPDDARAIVDDQSTSVAYADATDDQRASEELQWVKDGMIYDSHAVSVTVEVADEGDEQLVVKASYDGGVFSNEQLGAPYGGVRVKKVDAADGHALEGAVFAVETQDMRYTMTTDADGIAELAGNTLPAGRYTVVEAEAPEGYALNSSWSADFEIVDDGVIVDLTGYPCEDDSDGVALPATGHPGVSTLAFAGLAAVLVGLRRLVRPA